ncbi:hypothetical protein B0T16DRAFT_406211 [Cercophora newfieldiana]|uniref:Plethodontid modulating factor n=1 Tax=Cercophora newfieldiana TaxID=92897 RepID=A0AA39YGY2_9PEZI|nr:hypothetical protein B0T16DRAFT_406211 [Cercophora newfieldiana]
MKILSIVSAILLSATLTSACGDNAYRCVTRGGSGDDDWKLSQKCAKKNGVEDDCYCSHRAEYFQDPSGEQIEKFKDCCTSHGADWMEC